MNRRSPIESMVGKQPENCQLIEGPTPYGNEAFERAKQYVALHPELNCCNVDAFGMVTKWKAPVSEDGHKVEVVLKDASIKTTFFYVDKKLPLAK